MKHILAAVALTLTLGVMGTASVHAEYVLPYPSFMPGNKMYAVMRVMDLMKARFYFGNISSYKYHLALSDKYLVEAKTLFEYKQYLLALEALSRSDSEFAKAPVYLLRAREEKKDVRLFVTQLMEASDKHKLVLGRIADMTPPTFTWSPEKSEASVLELSRKLRESVMVRDNAVILLK